MLGLLKRIKNEDGTTLVELLVYAAILVLVIGGAYTIYEGSERIYSSSSSQADAQRSSRTAQAAMTKHLRMVESFVTADDYSISIRADIDDDNLWEEVSYYIEKDASDIYRLYSKVEGGAERELAYGLQNVTLGQPLFVYYDLHDTAITTDTASRKTKTHRIGVNLVVDTDLSSPPGAYTLSSKVSLRNK